MIAKVAIGNAMTRHIVMTIRLTCTITMNILTGKVFPTASTCDDWSENGKIIKIWESSDSYNRKPNTTPFFKLAVDILLTFLLSSYNGTMFIVNTKRYYVYSKYETVPSSICLTEQ